jgi:signal transduction histidine kinase
MQLEVDTPGGRRVLGYGLHILDDAAIVAMIFTDLSETLDRERRAHAERQVSDAGRPASAMAHELTSPLATIGLYVDLLRRQLPADGPARGNLDVIAEQLVDCRSRLSTILHSMAGTAAGDSGLRLSSLAGAIEAIIEEQRLRAPQTELRLSVSSDGSERKLQVLRLRGVPPWRVDVRDRSRSGGRQIQARRDPRGGGLAPGASDL